VSWTFSLAAALAAACTCETAPPPGADDRVGTPTPTPTPAPAAADGPAAPAAAAAGPADAKPAEPPLTAEEQRLIAADPKTLSREDVRKRAFALRRKILQNPDSDASRALEDLRRAVEAGEVQPPGGGLHFEARKAADAPTDSPPAGSRPDDAKTSSVP